MGCFGLQMDCGGSKDNKRMMKWCVVVVFAKKELIYLSILNWQTVGTINCERGSPTLKKIMSGGME